MKSLQEPLKKYARLAIHTGVNIQKGQPLIINCPIEGAEFAHLLVEEAYDAGAEDVRVEWNDEVLTRMKFEREPMHVLENYPEWKVKMLTDHVKKGGAVLSVYAPNPDLLKGVDPKRMATANKAAGEALKDYRAYMMNDRVQWSLVSIPTEKWAKKVFPDLSEKEAVEKLWEQIFRITRVDQEDPIVAWKKHNERLRKAREILNEKQYKKLIYKAPGTDLEIELPENHIWSGGSAVAETGAEFNPNMPTEEVFTAPHKDGVNGTVVNTKPLNYNGNLIDQFSLTFKDGKVVDFSAEVGYETLKHLLDTDEGSRRLGEVALVPHNSPISQSGLIFYNTLYDENASCHLALGEAYPTTIVGGSKLSEEELKERGMNVSINHEDFMMGSADLDIDGVTKDGKTEPIMRNGNWALAME
ncbi:aminopeptidase II [Melghiribacillus thermohalophilus]|uniref:Aminopeptidase II n=1 Tax=Melghiribacillus thermohalophilus TaxID=1324956 RepID=A0A4R3NCZ0_9BACI|nr:aminopeptidase [Melghiribacillus thermohalophilus]TCT26310.1 aminopeptidase II [Melghiribacillus thermohalophilus]